MSSIQIIKTPDDNKPFAVIYKPSGLPTAPLNENDTQSAFSQAAKLFPELLTVKGKKEVEHGLIHRLDTATCGLVIIAATQECYDFLINEQQNDRIIKWYSAVCKIAPCRLEGFPALNVIPEYKTDSHITLSSFFRAYGPGRKQVRPVTTQSGTRALEKTDKPVLYTTDIFIKNIDSNTDLAKTECRITKGYRHQVRCHLAWCGLPVINDRLYNPDTSLLKDESTEPMKFCASKIEFEYPRGDLNSYDRKDTWT